MIIIALTVIIAGQTTKINLLIQEISLLKKKVNDLVREFQINMVAEATDSYFKIKAAKEETFRKIYTDIQKEADSILSPWRKR